MCLLGTLTGQAVRLLTTRLFSVFASMLGCGLVSHKCVTVFALVVMTNRPGNSLLASPGLLRRMGTL